MPSIVGIGASGEAYLGGYSGLAGVNGGVRALAELRSLFLKVGVDYDLQREDASFILSLTVPLRRGGILGHGTQLRVDWLPGRGNSWNFGLQVPLEPHMGKTRFRDTEVDMPRGKAPARPPVDPAVAAAMREAHASARAIAVLSSAFWPDERTDRQKSLAQSRERILEFKRLIGQASALRPQGVRMETEVRILHDQVDLAFGLATGATGAEAGPAGARSGRSRARGRRSTRCCTRTTASSASTSGRRSSGASPRRRGSASRRGSTQPAPPPGVATPSSPSSPSTSRSSRRRAPGG